jgi:hypothetical protein
MTKFLDKCPAFVFLAAFPQLTSRICHSHPGKFDQGTLTESERLSTVDLLKKIGCFV